MFAGSYNSNENRYEADHGRKEQNRQRRRQKPRARNPTSKRKTYYEILGIARSATLQQIKTARNEMAMKYHPDKNASANEAQKLANENAMKEINEAFDVLSDESRRFMYDFNTFTKY